MKQFGSITETSITETSKVETTRVDATEHSPVRERVGRYLFWALVIALLCARAIYPPTGQPVTADMSHQAKTEAAR